MNTAAPATLAAQPRWPALLPPVMIAIPAVISWSYYSKKIENLTVELETLCDEFLRKHYHSDAARRAK